MSSTQLVLEDFIPRQFWGPREAGYPLRLFPPATYVFVSYNRKNYLGPQAKRSPGPSPNQDACCQELCYCLNGDYMRRLPDIRFNFMVCGGKMVDIYEGRGWTRQPNLPLKYNRLNHQSLYIGIIGDFTEQDPNQNIFDKIESLLQYAVQNRYLKERFIKVDLANPFKKKEELKTPTNYISSIYL